MPRNRPWPDEYYDKGYLMQKAHTAGVVFTSFDYGAVLLGSHKIPDDYYATGPDIIRGDHLLWGPFAGAREILDQSAIDIAKRETLEETGCKIDIDLADTPALYMLKYENAYRYPRENPKIGVIFLVVLSGSQELLIPNQEIHSVRWFSAREIDNEIDDPVNLWGHPYTTTFLNVWLAALSNRRVSGVAVGDYLNRHEVVRARYPISFENNIVYNRYKKAERIEEGRL